MSSVAFILAAGWILWLAARGTPEDRATTVVFAVAVAANGFGSFLYHGPQPSWGRWAHDLAIVAVLLFLVGNTAGPIRRWPAAAAIGAYLVALTMLGLALGLFRAASDPFTGALAAGALGGHLEARPRSSEGRPTGHPSSGRAMAVALGAAGLGVVAFLLGRTGSPWCSPGSWFQWHAVWHVLIAVAMACYASAALSLRSIRVDDVSTEP